MANWSPSRFDVSIHLGRMVRACIAACLLRQTYFFVYPLASHYILAVYSCISTRLSIFLSIIGSQVFCFTSLMEIGTVTEPNDLHPVP